MVQIIKRFLVGVFAVVCANALADDTLVNKLREAGIPLVAAREYVRNVEIFAKYDRLYGMAYHSWRLENQSDFSQEPAFLDARQAMIDFHKRYGNENPATDAANFVRARRYYESTFSAPKNSPLDLADLRARLSQGQGNFDRLGKNGPTISGPGISIEMQGNHMRELSMTMQARNSALKNLVDLMDKYGELKFTDYKEAQASFKLPAAEEALLAANDGRLMEKIAEARNSLIPERPVSAAQVHGQVLGELDGLVRRGSLAQTENWESLLSIAVGRALIRDGVDAVYGSPGVERWDGEWNLPLLVNKKATEEAYDSARLAKPLTIRSGFDHTNAEIIGLITQHFQPVIDNVIATVASRQKLRAGRSLEDLQAYMKMRTAEDLMIPIVNSFDRTNELTYDITGIGVAYNAMKALAGVREAYFEPAAVPSQNDPRLASVAQAPADGPCHGRNSPWRRLATSVMTFFGGGR